MIRFFASCTSIRCGVIREIIKLGAESCTCRDKPPTLQARRIVTPIVYAALLEFAHKEVRVATRKATRGLLRIVVRHMSSLTHDDPWGCDGVKTIYLGAFSTVRADEGWDSSCRAFKCKITRTGLRIFDSSKTFVLDMKMDEEWLSQVDTITSVRGRGLIVAGEHQTMHAKLQLYDEQRASIHIETLTQPKLWFDVQLLMEEEEYEDDASSGEEEEDEEEEDEEEEDEDDEDDDASEEEEEEDDEEPVTKKVKVDPLAKWTSKVACE